MANLTADDVGGGGPGVSAGSVTSGMISWPLQGPTGSDAAPTFSFSGRTSDGMRDDGNDLMLIFAASQKIKINGSRVQCSLPLQPASEGGSDFGSAAAEWGDGHFATGKVIYTDSGQNMSIGSDALNKMQIKDGATEIVEFTATSVIWDVGQKLKATVAIADAATIATDTALGHAFSVTLTANRTLGAPTNMIAGDVYTWFITQDGGGTNTLAYNAVFLFPNGTTPVLSTGGGEIDILTGVSDGTNVYAALRKDFS